ncbi:hypothetical protein GQ43DRAFT_443620 [Delitschia confertaspora ATCC 74209]|uniref:Cytochrome c oxidase-assembly factor COX23, mitochondrial n=1 Tax=Delitschia confertaspora ATCC 74209 TaxID=1513339 RepID=A0A9P4JEX7_9PLEO|nr:hypothetical protein GQ43DRAFT_443620 [Delitschia confertaspora ATCC 74209]
MASKAPADAPAPSNPASDVAEAQWTGKTASTFENKQYSQYFDPCQEAAQKSIRCLHRNGGERDMCTDFFQAYRDCKEQWINARKEARRAQGKWW